MSGGYTARTGRDIFDLPFHLLIDVCHDTINQRIAADKDAWTTWQDHLNAPPARWWFPALPYAAAAAAANTIDRVLHPDGTVEVAGWDDATLLAQMQRAART